MKHYKLDDRADKSFEKFLNEDYSQVVHTPGMSSVKGMHRIEKDEILAQLNSYLSAALNKQFLNPYNAINTVRVHLNQAGLNFDDFLLDGRAGSISVPLSQFGGRFGHTRVDGVVRKDDGIEHRVPEGLVIKFRWDYGPSEGRMPCYLSASIVKGKFKVVDLDDNIPGESDFRPNQGSSQVNDPLRRIDKPLEEDDLSSEPLPAGDKSDPINKNEKQFTGKQTDNGEKKFRPKQGTSEIDDDLKKVDQEASKPTYSKAGH